ncbi:MAG: DNA polymerase I [Kiritimatiellae bacterium]|nr:DNA polymerase I [Kiritimatiellia bacterium]
MKKLFVIDLMPFLYRGHFVFLKNPRMTSTGINTSSLTGFANSVVQILKEYEPTHVVLAMDSSTTTFRKEKFPAYKAQREKMPEDLAASIPMAMELATALRIPVLRVDGYEADDLMGTLAAIASRQEGWETYLATPDKDAAQLVGPRTLLFRPGKGGSAAEIYNEQKVLEHWGLSTPRQMIDYLGLAGDASDNIPGVAGVGEKTAMKLLQQYNTLEEVLAHASEIKGKLGERVAASAEDARLSKWLAEIRTDVPLEVDLESFARCEPDAEALLPVLRKYELFSLGRRLLGENAFDSFPSEEEEKYVKLATFPHNYVCVRTEDQIQALLTELENAERWSFDTETTGLDPRHDRLVGMSFSTAPGKAWWVPVPVEREACIAFLRQFAPAFANPFSIKIGHNAKFDLTILRQYGIELKGELRDTMLAHYVLDAADYHNMDHCARELLGYDPIPISTLIGEKKKGTTQGNMGDLPVEFITDYAAEDADVTLRLDEALRPKVRDAGMLRALSEVEEPLIPVLLDMETEGIRVDEATLKEYGKELDHELIGLVTRINELGGGNFNPASPKQLGEVLFERLKLDPNATKTASGQYATSEEILVKLQQKHPIVPAILEYRACSKLKSTYVDKLPDFRDENGRIHTTFSQALTETGRLSSSDPNLQNIPIRTERGQRIRAAFVARDENHVILSADYSQIELRVMAAMSRDPSLMEAFRNHEDIHLATAARVYGMPKELITDEMRSACKRVNFGIIYGISAFGLSQRLNVSRKEAGDLIETYFAQYPGVKAYMEKAKADAHEKGYAETLLGRRRSLRDINSRNATSRQAAERNAINTPIQGTAADLIKLAMIRIHRELHEKRLCTKMILQIHDELLFDVPKEETDTVRTLVENAMVNVWNIGVPLEVGIGTGPNWLEAH